MQSEKVFLCVQIAALAIAGTLAIGCAPRREVSTHVPMRIVSLAPSITETLFALGLGDRVVAVTSYCIYPPQTASIEKLGGFADANLEKIISLRPDLVVLSRDHEKQRVYLDRFNVLTLTADISTCEAVCSTFANIGALCGKKREADSLIGLFDKALTKTDTATMNAPKILFCVGRDSPGAGRIKSVYVAGRKTFYNDLIEAAGAQNVIAGNGPTYPRLSPEGIMSLAPDIIVDVAPAMGDYNCSLLVKDWYSISRIPATRTKRVYCMSKDYATVPGPRMLLLLDDLKRIVLAKAGAGHGALN